MKTSFSLKIFKFNVTNSGLAVVAALTFLLLVPAQPDHAGLQVDSSLVPSECCDACNFFHSP